MKKLLILFVVIFASKTGFSQEEKMQFSLQEAIAYALVNGYNARVAENDIAAAKKKVWETTAIGLPQISGKVDYQNFLKQQVTLIDIDGDGTEEEFVFGTKQNLNAAVTLNQLIFDGSYLVGLQASRTYLKISEQARQKSKLQTREAVINAYGNVLVAQKSIEILSNNLAIVQKNLSDAKKIYANGFTEEEDVEQLEITYSTIKTQLNNVKRMEIIAYRLLNISIGNPIATGLVLTDSLESLAQENLNLNLINSDFSVESHIDFKIAANDSESKRLLMKLEQSKALPTLAAFVNYGTQSFSNSFTFFDSNQPWFNYSLLGVSLKVPIFSSLSRSAKTVQAKIALENSQIRLEEITQKLNLQVQTARSDYQFSIENYQSAQRNLNLAERIENKQRIKFFEGISSSFDLLQAQNQLYTQQQNYVQSMLDVIAKKAALENALNIPIK